MGTGLSADLGGAQGSGVEGKDHDSLTSDDREANVKCSPTDHQEASCDRKGNSGMEGGKGRRLEKNHQADLEGNFSSFLEGNSSSLLDRGNKAEQFVSIT